MTDSNLFNLALNEDNDVDSLMNYYRDRVLDFDKERQEWLARLQQVRFSQDERHKLEWDLKHKTEECIEHQRVAEESKLQLYEERATILELQRENNALRVKEQQDRKKIEELMSICQPVEQNVILRKDLRPDVKQRYVSTEKRNLGAKNYGVGRTVLKTIYLPNEQLNTLGQENQQLKNQIKQVEQLYQEQISELKRQIQNCQQNKYHKNQDAELKYQAILEKNQNIEKQLLNVNKEYFTIRRQYTDKITNLQETNSSLRQKNVVMAQNNLQTQTVTNVKNQAIKSVLQQKTQDYSEKCMKIVNKKDRKLELIKEQYAAIQKVSLNKIKKLEKNLVFLAEKYKKLEQGKNLQVQGYKTQIRQLKDKNLRMQHTALLQIENLNPIQPKSNKIKKQKKSNNINQNTIKKNRKRSRKSGNDKMKTQKQKIISDIENMQDNEQELSSLESDYLEKVKQQLETLGEKLDNSNKSNDIQF